jgi:P protein
MIASTFSIGVLAAMNERPTMAVVMSWIDVETLLLLFGMMILVAVLSETGIFDFLAVYAFKVIMKTSIIFISRVTNSN